MRDNPLTTLGVLYGLGCWLAFLVVGVGVLALGLPAPVLAWRRVIARNGARTYLALTGVRLHVEGLGHVPDGACVVVANHASYLDGLVMQAALPARFAFVIKQEMGRVPLAGLMLHRLGSEFVDRFNRHQGASDARRVVRRAAAGQALAFFPEGTFVARPGLGRFHAGAFLAAARAGLPVVPVVIRGTRHVLHPDSLLPRRGPITVRCLPALALPDLDMRAATARLREAARAAILSELGEPDLAAP